MSGLDRQRISFDGKIGLALSGGGSRAIAFHLGCLRALRDIGILNQVTTISSVSGGSVLAALYCQTPGDFDEFEAKTRRLLQRGFMRSTFWMAISSKEGLKSLMIGTAIAVDRLVAFFVRHCLRLVGLRRLIRAPWLRESPIRRGSSRTTILRRVFSALFDHQTLPQLRQDRPKLIIVACELQTKSAFYFAADGVGSWQLGVTAPDDIEVANAVAASAAFPLLLPALDEVMAFTKDGVTSRHRVILTDGGVYDNLALAPLWPGRDPAVSLHVDHYPRIIACRAGYALKRTSAPSFFFTRMSAVFEGVHARAQNLTMNRIFDLKRAGDVEAFLIPYLSQKDDLLTVPGSDLITAEQVADYPTDFSAMSQEWVDKLVVRGEQVTRALVAQYWSEPTKEETS